jgi:transcriptional regulator with XRE-family HTH domain
MRKSIFSKGQEQLQNLLRTAREAAGLTQTQAAEKLNKPQSFISKIESGERRLDLIELKQVCAAFGVSVTDFVRSWEKIQDKKQNI